MRASWSGHLRIGDIIIPIKLFAATRSVAPKFIQLHAKDNSPVTRLTVCMQDGEELADGDIVKAAEYDGKYVRLSEDEIERHSQIERNIVIRQFTDPGDIDPLYYDKPFYVVPGAGGEVGYAILRRAFERAKKAAIATMVFYGHERLAVITARESLLMVQTLHFADEIVPRSSIKSPALPQPAPAHVSTATQLMEHYESRFYVEDYRNVQRDLLNELVERKAKGLSMPQSPKPSPEATPPGEVVPRMRALLESSPKTLGAKS